MGGALGVVSANSLQGIDWWYTPDGLALGVVCAKFTARE